MPDWLARVMDNGLHYLGFFFGPKIYADHVWLDVLAKLDVGYDPRRGTGTGRQGTFPPPLHPMGTEIAPLSSPRGLNTYQIHPLMDEIPVGDRGSVAIPSVGPTEMRMGARIPRAKV